MEFKVDVHNWSRQLYTTPHETRSELLFKKLSDGGKRIVWERILKHVHPAIEVEHVRKNLALKRAEEKLQLRRTLASKEKEMIMKDYEFEEVHKNLSVLNCKQQVTKQRTDELCTKTLLLHCKEQDLTKKAQLYEELCQLGYEPDHSIVCDSIVSTVVQENLILECEEQLEKFHQLYRSEDMDKQILYSKRESVESFVRHKLLNLHSTDIWHAMLTRMDKLNADTRVVALKCIKWKPENLQFLKNHLSTEIQTFRLHSQLGLCFSNHGLQQKKKHDDVILSQEIEKLQELVSKSTIDTSLEREEIRQWLELQMKCAELNAFKGALELELKNSTVKSPQFDIPSLWNKETEKRGKQIKMLQEYIQANFRWLMVSYTNTVRIHENLKKEISISGMHITPLSVMKDSFEQELKVFLELSLHMLYRAVLPCRVSPSNQQLLQYHHHIGHGSDTHKLTDMLSVLGAGTCTCPQSIILRLLEKHLFLVFLENMQLDTNWDSTLVPFDISSVRNTENPLVTSVTETMRMMEKSLESCRIIAQKAKDNLITWIEHPLQCAVPSSLQHNGKNFQQWKQEFDAALTAIDELED
ncbi:uncharacterized protein [Periplaneta americana]|uniref:uncharacterized protein n=1 Tax=Periplaneta americana TaxID=6978 RepID=UPI0037E98213